MPSLMGPPLPVQLGVGALPPSLGATTVHRLLVRRLPTDGSHRWALETKKEPSGLPRETRPRTRASWGTLAMPLPAYQLLSQPGQVRSSRCEGATCWAHHAQSSEWDPHPASEGPLGTGQGAAKASISRVNTSSSYCNADELESAGRVQQGKHREDPLKLPSQLEVYTASQPAAPQGQLGFPLQRVAPGAGGAGRPQGQGRWGPISQDVRGLSGWRGLRALS